jgi:hypothetical protein
MRGPGGEVPDGPFLEEALNRPLPAGAIGRPSGLSAYGLSGVSDPVLAPVGMNRLERSSAPALQARACWLSVQKWHNCGLIWH